MMTGLVGLMPFAENMLAESTPIETRKVIEQRREFLRQAVWSKNGVIYWNGTDKPVPLEVFKDAHCTPHRQRAQEIALRPVSRPRLIRSLSEAQNHRCCFCGVQTTYRLAQDNTATIEHVIPQGHGGPNSYRNLAMSCLTCNDKRKTIDAETFLEGKLWLPQNEHVRQLVMKMVAFRRHPHIGILKAMERFCLCGTE